MRLKPGVVKSKAIELGIPVRIIHIMYYKKKIKDFSKFNKKWIWRYNYEYYLVKTIFCDLYSLILEKKEDAIDYHIATYCATCHFKNPTKSNKNNWVNHISRGQMFRIRHFRKMSKKSLNLHLLSIKYFKKYLIEEIGVNKEEVMNVYKNAHKRCKYRG